MILRHSPNAIHHAQVASTLNTSPDDLRGLMNYFLVSSKVGGKSPLTIARYQDIFNHFLAFTQTATRQSIRAFLLAEQERGLAMSSVNLQFRFLKALFNWLV